MQENKRHGIILFAIYRSSRQKATLISRNLLFTPTQGKQDQRFDFANTVYSLISCFKDYVWKISMKEMEMFFIMLPVFLSILFLPDDIFVVGR